ncbi:hypothetical protein SAMN02745108_01044 [Fibrobacter intestinalis]|uniref:Uncharacterized protein n=1 Tax=Fibrobacter intestinalis TaxID=28122 RepID=A0A1T4LXV5_9BACT|nr:hypothetical protein BGW94_2516 [Fibrobacter sp. NR9]SJZ59294.1 hypothetical protein SAMN02745108_01044 [Fibrobacter intestinalis]
MNENTPQTSQTYFIDAMVTKFSVEGKKNLLSNPRDGKPSLSGKERRRRGEIR